MNTVQDTNIDTDIPLLNRIMINSIYNITKYLFMAIFICYSLLFPFIMACIVESSCLIKVDDEIVNNYFFTFTFLNIITFTIYVIVLLLYVVGKYVCQNNYIISILEISVYALTFLSFFINFIVWITGWNLQYYELMECQKNNHIIIQYGMIPYILSMMILFIWTKHIENSNIYQRNNNDEDLNLRHQYSRV